jgi:hypothetical protein
MGFTALPSLMLGSVSHYSFVSVGSHNSVYYPIIHPAAYAPPLQHRQIFSSSVALAQNNALTLSSITKRQVVTAGSLDIQSCVFDSLEVESACGGAIISDYPLFIFNCLFVKCKSDRGGAISTTSPVSMFLTTTSSCSARDCGFIDIQSESSEDIVIAESTFFAATAGIFGMGYRCAQGICALTHSNLTECQSHGSVAAMEIKGGIQELRFVFLLNCTAGGPNSGFCMRQALSLEINNSIFANCVQFSVHWDAGAAVIIIDCPNDGLISNCAFFGNDPSDGYVVAVTNGVHLTLIDCCFTGPQPIPVNEGATYNCKFLASHCEIRITLPLAIGYGHYFTRPQRTARSVNVLLIPQRNSSQPSPGNSHKLRVWTLSGAVGGLVVVVVAVIHFVVSQICCGQGKIPKAFQ